MALTVGTDSYVTLEMAEAYALAGLDAGVWTAADAATREAALREAHRALESLSGWRGVPYLDGQRSAWPRVQVYAPDGLAYPCGDPGEAESYPQPLRDAQCEEALERLKRRADPTSAFIERDRANGIASRRSSDGADVHYGTVERYGGALYSQRAYLHVLPLLAQSFTGVSPLCPSNICRQPA